jgi:hypothetical protein
MSYSISNNATVDGLSESSPSTLAQELANNTRVIAPPPSTATQDANDSRVLQGIGTRDLSAMTLGTSLTVNSDTLQQLQLRNQGATTFTGGGNIIRFSNASITQETGLAANPDTAPGGATPLTGSTANANPWEADFTDVAGASLVTGLTFQNSTRDNRNIWDPTFQFSVAAQPGGITYRVTTNNAGDGIDYVNVRNGTPAAGGGATADTVTSNAITVGGGAITDVPVTGGAAAYLGRNVLGLTLTGLAATTVTFTDANGAPIATTITLGTTDPTTFNVAPLGFYVSASDSGAGTITLSNPTGVITITVGAADLATMVLIMGARFAVSDADGNDAVPSAPLVAGPITFLQDQNAIAHYLDFGRDTALNAQRLHDAIFGNSHGRTESKSQLLSLSDLAANPGVDLFVGTSTADPITEVVSPAAVNSAGVHVVFLTDLGQATLAGGNGNTTGRCANVQLIDSQDNTNFEVKLLAEWLADGSTTAGETAGTFPRMQFTRVQDGMTSPSN